VSAEQVSQFIHRASQFVIVGLISAVLYFVREIHSEVKDTTAKVGQHDTQLQVLKTEHNFLTGRVDVLSRYCYKQPTHETN
jgi:hypothetical protein